MSRHKGGITARNNELDIDPWQKAHEYQMAMNRITEPKLRAIFAEFRDLWIALAKGNSFLRPLNWTLRLKPSAISTTSGFQRGSCRSGDAFR
jgi:hypothetical protein